jgi:uncharacterized protein YihD (DUF1040 family)
MATPCVLIKPEVITYLARYGYVQEATSNLIQALSSRECNTTERKHLSNLYLHCMVYNLKDRNSHDTNQHLK